MRHSGESPGRRSLALPLAVVLASSASSACYETTAHDREMAPAEPPSKEMSSSGEPPSASEPAPSMPQPAEPPHDPGEPTTGVPDPAPALPTDTAVSFRPEPGFLFMQNSQFAGDLDGDGFDDVVLFALALDEQQLLGALETAAYVFYGRSAPPTVLEAAHADAVLRGKAVALTAPGWNPSAAIGDLNGDGFDDLVLGSMDGAYFVFGGERRLVGDRDIADAAVSWTFPEASSALSERPVRVVAAGDVQGDGLADVGLIVSSERVLADGPDGSVTTTSADSTYLVLGREEQDGWPTGVVEPDWAQAVFVMEDAFLGGCSLYGAADLDGDGFSDLVLQADSLRRFVSGGDDLPEGETEATEAGEAFDLPGQWARALPDLDGDGSQELAWTHLLNSQQLNLSFGDKQLDPALRVEPALVIDAAGMRLPATAVGDVDGDGTQELLVIAGDSAERPFGLYMIHIERVRGTAEIGLEDARLVLTLPGVGASFEPTVGTGLDASGDMNGDGIADVLITTVVAHPAPRGTTEVRLLLGGTDLDGR